MPKPQDPGTKTPTSKFIQITGVNNSLYALDGAGVVFRYVQEKDVWLPMSMEVVIQL